MNSNNFNQDDFPFDDASMRMSHPRRIRAYMEEHVEGFKLMLGPEWPTLERALRSPDFTLASITSLAHELGLRRLSMFIEQTANNAASTELGGPISLLMGIRQFVAPCPHFLVDDTLLDMLVQTDMANDISVGTIKLPYQRMYLELGTKRVLGENIPNAETGDHILEGAYFESGLHPSRGQGLYLVITGSPLGKLNCMDDATLAVFISQSDPDASLVDVIHDSIAVATESAIQGGLRPPLEESVDPTLRSVVLLTKALLYISLPEARRQNMPELTQGLKDAERLKNPAKKAKALKKAAKLIDYIIIKPAPEHEKVFSAGGGAQSGHRKVHWRRGHYRMHRHGVGLKEVKLLFIAPTLVGAEGAGAAEDAPKNYVVR